MSAAKTSKAKAPEPTIRVKKNQAKSQAKSAKILRTANRSGTGVGGARPGAGRPKGVPNRATRAVMEAVMASGETPLEFMIKIMRGEACPADASPQEKAAYASLRFEAAKASAPYIHSRLSSVEMAATVAKDKDGKPAKVPSDPIDASKAYKDLMG